MPRDFKRRRLDTEFLNLSPLVVPFNQIVFYDGTPQSENVRGEEFNIKQKKNHAAFDLAGKCSKDKETQTNSNLGKSDKSTQTEFKCTCLDNERKSDVSTSNDWKKCAVDKISSDLPVENHIAPKSNQNSHSSVAVRNSTSSVLEESKIKKCYVVVERIDLEKNASVSVEGKHSSSKDSGNAKISSVTVSGVSCKEVSSNTERMSKASPRVCLRRVEDTVKYFSYLNLRPLWKNDELFQLPERRKRLGRTRQSSKYFD